MISNTNTNLPELKPFKQLYGLQSQIKNYKIKANNIVSQIYEEKFTSTPYIKYNSYFDFNIKKNLDTLNDELNLFTCDGQIIPEYMQPLVRIVLCFFYPKVHMISDILYKFTWEEIQELTYDENLLQIKNFLKIIHNPEIINENQVYYIKEFIELNKENVEFLEWKPRANYTLHLCQEFVKITQEIIQKKINNTNKFAAKKFKNKILPTKKDIFLKNKFKNIIKKGKKPINIPSLRNIVNINFLDDNKDSQLKKRNLKRSTELDKATDILENKTTFKIKKTPRRDTQIVCSKDNTSIDFNKNYIFDLNSQKEIKNNSRSRRTSKRNSFLTEPKGKLLKIPNSLSSPSIENFDNFEKIEIPSISIKFIKSSTNLQTKSGSNLNIGSQESTTVSGYSLKNSFTNRKFDEKKKQTKIEHFPSIKLLINPDKSINNFAKLDKSKSCQGSVRGGKIQSINNFL